MPDDHISLSEASELAGVSPTTLQRWVKAGVIPVKGGGGRPPRRRRRGW